MVSRRGLDGRAPPASDDGGPRLRRIAPHRSEPRQVVMIRILRALVAVTLLVATPFAAAVIDAGAQEMIPPGPTTELSVDTSTGTWPFQVELADDAAERAQGLMYRREMAPDHGMLFDMGETRPVGFWMKNTIVSLDIIFIGTDGRVRSIAEDTAPFSEAVIASGVPVRFVLELVAGTARKINLRPGDLVRHPRISAVAG
jgi:uncharacterized membrane protein (UPF0127 family)